jgi:putative transposase
MPAGLKRHYGQGDLHFLTFSCYHRLPLLHSARAKTAFLKILGEVRDRYGFLLLGYVVMPDHVHLLISEPRQGTPSTVVQVLKQRSSRRLRAKRRKPHARQLSLPFPENGPLPRRFWQTRFFDFNVWSRKKQREKLDYMHANPVRGGLVSHPKDWPWSSFLFYARGEPGLAHIDLPR